MGSHFCTSCEKLVRLGLVTTKEVVRAELIIVEATFLSLMLMGGV